MPWVSRPEWQIHVQKNRGQFRHSKAMVFQNTIPDLIDPFTLLPSALLSSVSRYSSFSSTSIMHSENQLPAGLYELLIDQELGALLESRPDLVATIVAIDDESAPHTYSQFLAQLLHQALPIVRPEKRLAIINRLVVLLSAEDGLDYTKRKQLLSRTHNLHSHKQFRCALAPPGNLAACSGAPHRVQFEDEVSKGKKMISCKFAGGIRGHARCIWRRAS